MPLTGHCSDSSDRYVRVYLHASAPGPPLLLSYHHPHCSSRSDDRPVPVRHQRCQPRLPVHGPSCCDLQVLATYQSSHINIRRRAYGQQRYVSACNRLVPTRCHKHPTEDAVHCSIARDEVGRGWVPTNTRYALFGPALPPALPAHSQNGGPRGAACRHCMRTAPWLSGTNTPSEDAHGTGCALRTRPHCRHPSSRRGADKCSHCGSVQRTVHCSGGCRCRCVHGMAVDESGMSVDSHDLRAHYLLDLL